MLKFVIFFFYSWKIATFAYIFIQSAYIMSSLTNKTDRCMYRQWDYDYASFGEALRKARRSRDLTQDQVAEKIGVARSTVWKMEKGGYCSPLTMFKISKLLEVDFMAYNIVVADEDQRTRSEL